MTKDSSDYYILLIEDNPGDIVLIQEYLSEQIQNPHITIVSNFLKASDILKKNIQFDIILLDLSLPDKFGTELINEVLEMGKDIPVIILTDFSDMGFSIKSISYGVSDYLIKNDLNASSLYKSILYCLERKKRVHELQESEKRYSDLFRLNPQPIWIYEPETLKIITPQSNCMGTPWKNSGSLLLGI